MIIIIRLLMAFELTATMVQELGPSTHGVLPLGGSHLSQLGIALVLAVLIKEVWDTAKEARNVWRQRRRRAERRRQLDRQREEKRTNALASPIGGKRNPLSEPASTGSTVISPDTKE